MAANTFLLLGLLAAVAWALEGPESWPTRSPGEIYGPTGRAPSGRTGRPNGRPSRPPFLTTRTPRMEDNEEHQIISRLIVRNYPGTYARPVQDSEETLMVNLQFRMLNLVSVDKDNGLATVTGTLTMKWHDVYLVRENEGLHGNVAMHIADVRVPVSDIWTPDIRSFDAIDETLNPATYAIARFDGQVTYTQKAKYTVQCEEWGYNRFSCTMRFFSRSYNGLQVAYDAASNSESNYDEELLVQHKKWEVQNLRAHAQPVPTDPTDPGPTPVPTGMTINPVLYYVTFIVEARE